MGNQISFWTPVRYEDANKSFGERWGERADEFFRWGREYAVVRMREEDASIITLGRENSDLKIWEIALRVAAYMTVVIPILMFIAKLVHRYSHFFRVNQNPLNQDKGWPLQPDQHQPEGSAGWTQVSLNGIRSKAYSQVIKPAENGKWQFFPPAQLVIEEEPYRIETIQLCQNDQIHISWRPVPQRRGGQEQPTFVPILNGSLSPVILHYEDGQQRIEKNGFVAGRPLPLSIEQAGE